MALFRKVIVLTIAIITSLRSGKLLLPAQRQAERAATNTDILRMSFHFRRAPRNNTISGEQYGRFFSMGGTTLICSMGGTALTAFSTGGTTLICSMGGTALIWSQLSDKSSMILAKHEGQINLNGQIAITENARKAFANNPEARLTKP